MIQEAIILAGGMGTRLRSEVSEFPKSMAPINGIPFLKYQLEFLAQSKIKTVYLAVGYLSDVIRNYFGDQFLDIDLKYFIEKQPLGTGGAIVQVLNQTQSETVLVLNGDTMFRLNLEQFYESHLKTKSDISLGLKSLKNFERYGVVQLNEQKRVIGFEEKQVQEEGLINGGVYLINKKSLLSYSFPDTFSFEKEVLESKYKELNFTGFIDHSYFLDIGIPSDFEKAQIEFRKYNDWNIDSSWTLFLDRDGVINTHIKNSYVTNIQEFNFIDGVLESISKLTELFGRIVVVTNQQCVGKGIISESELNEIHDYMIMEVEKNGGKIDSVFHAPNLEIDKNKLRKPNTGMAELAKAKFPEIDFSKSIIVGDSLTDMEFGKQMGMKTVYINDGLNIEFDRCFSSLKKFTKSVS